MAALGRHEGVARILSLRVRGLLAWWLRRTYSLLQTPGFQRKLRIVIDWTIALFLRPAAPGSFLLPGARSGN